MATKKLPKKPKFTVYQFTKLSQLNGLEFEFHHEKLGAILNQLDTLFPDYELFQFSPFQAGAILDATVIFRLRNVVAYVAYDGSED